MKFSENWLREWVEISVDTQTLVDKLTMAGLEVDKVSKAAFDFSQVLVGEIVERVSHPNAQKLSICQVRCDGNALLQIVCGANNALAGKKVAVAVVGAKIQDFKIKKAKLRGVDSWGMLCSASELGLTESSEGILHLPDDAPVGTDLREYLDLNDQVIDIDLTPNRGDCLSILGLAREVSALFEKPIKALPALEDKVALTESDLSFNCYVPEACLNYHACHIESVNLKTPTPLYIQERLRRGGVRLVNVVVDVCNYVMLELGQPMHAFDASKIAGQLQLRRGAVGEQITLLDGRVAELDDTCLVIADEHQAQALAGVMGGEDSSVCLETQTVILESASFAAIEVSKTAKRFNIISDASMRFERGTDPLMTSRALAYAVDLITHIAGGQALYMKPYTQDMVKDTTISFTGAAVQRHLGLSLDRGAIESMLERLYFQTRATKSGWMVTVPSFRHDISREIDLVEEIARLYGYDKIPESSEKISPSIHSGGGAPDLRSKLAHVLFCLGYTQTLHYSFCSRESLEALSLNEGVIALSNPMSDAMSVMRQSLWPGLIKTAQYNFNRQATDLRLFEIGAVYQIKDNKIKETNKLSLLISGNYPISHWSNKEREVDFFDLKGDVSYLFKTLNIEFSWGSSQISSLHPGRQVAIMRQGQVLGHLGQLHPTVAKSMGVSRPVYLVEVALQLKTLTKTYATPSKFPSIKRDLAFVVDEAVTCDQLHQVIKGLSGQLLTDLRVFDVYKGAGIEENKKSIALGLTFQDPSRTLVDDEINHLIQNIVDGVGSQLKATLRT